MKRVFISYRSSDGKKDAARLAADLAERFGDQAVFYDKHNLHGGKSWREQVNLALGDKPVVLVLLTPDYFGATENGEQRIHREDDPVRQELLAAFDTQATVLPLLTEGVTMPRQSALPADLARVTEAHALKLRTEDWRTDLARLVKDLQSLGLQRQDGGGDDDDASDDLTARKKPSYTLLISAVVLSFILAAAADKETDRDTVLGLAFLALGPAWMAWRSHKRLRLAPGTAPRVWSWSGLIWCCLVPIGLTGNGMDLPPSAKPLDGLPSPQGGDGTQQQSSTTPNKLLPLETLESIHSGAWIAQLSNGSQLPFTMVHQGQAVSLTTTSMDVRNDASFAPMNQWLAANRGFTVQSIRVRGQGQFSNGSMELQMQMTSGDGQQLLDEGAMTLAVTDGGRSLSGSLHFASGSPTSIRFVRP